MVIKLIEKIDLRQVEKQTYRFTFSDGIYDIAYGSLLIFIAIAPILREMIYLGYIFFMILPAPLIILLGKKFISIPRMGIVKFNYNRSKSKNKLMLLIAILFPLTVILVVLTFIGMFNVKVGGYIVPVGAGLFALLLLSTIAYTLEYPHFYLYAVSIGLGMPLAELMEPIVGGPLDYIISFGTSGTFLCIYGIITLIKFIKKYPIPKEEIPGVKG